MLAGVAGLVLDAHRPEGLVVGALDLDGLPRRAVVGVVGEQPDLVDQAALDQLVEPQPVVELQLVQRAVVEADAVRGAREPGGVAVARRRAARSGRRCRRAGSRGRPAPRGRGSPASARTRAAPRTASRACARASALGQPVDEVERQHPRLQQPDPVVVGDQPRVRVRGALGVRPDQLVHANVKFVNQWLTSLTLAWRAGSRSWLSATPAHERAADRGARPVPLAGLDDLPAARARRARSVRRSSCSKRVRVELGRGGRFPPVRPTGMLATVSRVPSSPAGSSSKSKAALAQSAIQVRPDAEAIALAPPGTCPGPSGCRRSRGRGWRRPSAATGARWTACEPSRTCRPDARDREAPTR